MFYTADFLESFSPKISTARVRLIKKVSFFYSDDAQVFFLGDYLVSRAQLFRLILALVLLIEP